MQSSLKLSLSLKGAKICKERLLLYELTADNVGKIMVVAVSFLSSGMSLCAAYASRRVAAEFAKMRVKLNLKAVLAVF